MKILISTPLFPPETHYPAFFSKELANQLSRTHDVIVLAFVDYPEKILEAGKEIPVLNVSKNQNLFLRLFKFFILLLRNVKNHDIIIVKQAGISSFLTIIVAKIFRKKTIAKIKEDEVEERIRQFNFSKKSWKIWEINFIQKKVLQYSDIIVFDNFNLKEKLAIKYNLNQYNLKVVQHPEKKYISPFLKNEKMVENLETEKREWVGYLSILNSKLNQMQNKLHE